MKKLTLILVLAICLLVYGESTGFLTPEVMSAFDNTEVTEPTTVSETEFVEQVDYLDVAPGTSKQLFIASNGLEVPYVLHIPENATADMPVILWMHGQGYLGKNLPEDYGVINKAKELDEDRFIIIQPTAYYGWHVQQQFHAVLELIDHVVFEYRADANRIILTGHSLGSLGAWFYAENATEYWAAVVPVANRCTTQMKAMYDASFSVWAFCGEWDTYDNRIGSEKAINALAEHAPYRDVRYTEMEACSHNDMAEAPYTAEFFDWAAAQYR